MHMHYRYCSAKREKLEIKTPPSVVAALDVSVIALVPSSPSPTAHETNNKYFGLNYGKVAQVVVIESLCSSLLLGILFSIPQN